VELALTVGELTRTSLRLVAATSTTAKLRTRRVAASQAFADSGSTSLAAFFPLAPAAPRPVDCTHDTSDESQARTHLHLVRGWYKPRHRRQAGRSSGEAAPHTFRPMSTVAKRSPISATAELLFTHRRNSVRNSGDAETDPEGSFGARSGVHRAGVWGGARPLP